MQPRPAFHSHSAMDKVASMLMAVVAWAAVIMEHGAVAQAPRVAIVGAGMAGAYTAFSLAQAHPEVDVDV